MGYSLFCHTPNCIYLYSAVSYKVKNTKGACGMKDIYIVQGGIFAEELTIDNVANCKVADISLQDGQGRDISITDVKSRLATRIKETATREKELARGTLRGRYEKGRFDEGNRNAEKFTSVEEEIYLLYLLCDNMQEVAELLGVCRQTVSKKIKQYKADNGL